MSPEQLGAQPSFALEPSAKHIEMLLAHDVVKIVTLAPELRGAYEAATALAKVGVRISVGHTAATYEAVSSLSEAVRQVGGTMGYTHLFNAMPSIEGRSPGVVGAALADPEAYSELILDYYHVHKGSFRATLSAKPNHLHLVTDAIRASATNKSETTLGSQHVQIRGGRTPE